MFSFLFLLFPSVPAPWGLPPGFGALPAGSEALPAGSKAHPAGSKAIQNENEKTEKISLCGDAIGHRPLRGRCPKAYDSMATFESMC